MDFFEQFLSRCVSMKSERKSTSKKYRYFQAWGATSRSLRYKICTNLHWGAYLLYQYMFLCMCQPGVWLLIAVNIITVTKPRESFFHHATLDRILGVVFFFNDYIWDHNHSIEMFATARTCRDSRHNWHSVVPPPPSSNPYALALTTSLCFSLSRIVAPVPWSFVDLEAWRLSCLPT